MNFFEKTRLGNILIYQTEKGDTKIDVFFQNGVIWMNQSAIARLYNTTPQNITMHIRNIYADGELDEFSTCKEFLQVQTEGKRKIKITLPKIADSSGDRRSAFPLAIFQEKEVDSFINILNNINT